MTQTTQTRLISMAHWCELARRGEAPPVTICLEGESMRPLIRRGRDPVTIVPLQRALRKGDVVLFTTGNGRYVVHRIWKLKEGFVQTFGDNCLYPDSWIPEKQVLGQVVRFSRDGRSIRLNTRLARAIGRIWMALYPMRKFYMRLRALGGRWYRKAFPKGMKGGDSNDQ